MLKSFSLEGINEGELRKFTAWGSVEVLDRHNEIIPIEEVNKIMDIWMSRDAPIMFNHTSQKIGKGLSWRPETKDGLPGVLITGIIHKNYSEDDKIWADMIAGKFEGLSIGGKARKVQKNGQTYLENLIGYEFSLVEATGNQEATFVDMNTLAKSKEKQMVEEKIIKAEDNVAAETQEISTEDRVARLEEAVGAVMSKVDELLQATAGTPETEEVAEAEKAEEETEEPKEELGEEKEVEKEEEESEDDVEKAEEEEDESEDMKKSLESMKAEMSELKKQLAEKTVVEVAKSEMPATKVVTEKKSISFTEVMKGRATLEEFTKQNN